MSHMFLGVDEEGSRLDEHAADVEVGAHGFLAALHGDHAGAERHECLDGCARP